MECWLVHCEFAYVHNYIGIKASLIGLLIRIRLQRHSIVYGFRIGVTNLVALKMPGRIVGEQNFAVSRIPGITAGAIRILFLYQSSCRRGRMLKVLMRVPDITPSPPRNLRMRSFEVAESKDANFALACR